MLDKLSEDLNRIDEDDDDEEEEKEVTEQKE